MTESKLVRSLLILVSIAALVALTSCAAPSGSGSGEATESAGEGAAGESSEQQESTPPPAPQTVTVRVPAGTLIDVSFESDLSTGVNMNGDSFRASVLTDVVHEGRVVIPGGSSMSGTVDEVISAANKKIGGAARMELSFNTVSVPTGDVAIQAWLSEKGKSETAKDAATIGGAAVVGAILGHQVEGDDEGKAIGAIVGAAAGTAIAAKTKGKELEIPAGTVALIELGAPIEVEVKL
jgi:hypothetical protein